MVSFFFFDEPHSSRKEKRHGCLYSESVLCCCLLSCFSCCAIFILLIYSSEVYLFFLVAEFANLLLCSAMLRLSPVLLFCSVPENVCFICSYPMRVSVVMYRPGVERTGDLVLHTRVVPHFGARARNMTWIVLYLWIDSLRSVGRVREAEGRGRESFGFSVTKKRVVIAFF